MVRPLAFFVAGGVFAFFTLVAAFRFSGACIEAPEGQCPLSYTAPLYGFLAIAGIFWVLALLDAIRVGVRYLSRRLSEGGTG